MFRDADGRLYENEWTRDGYKPVEVGREYPHQCVSCDAVISNGNRSTHSINGVPQKCERCSRHSEICKVTARIRKRINEHLASREAGKKVIHRDTACRYIARYGGSTYQLQTDADNSKIYLKNSLGKTLAKVLPTDRYPKPVEVFDLPF